MTDSSSSSSGCADLFQMKNGATCTDPWHKLRDRLHPAQAAVGYAAVQRKHEKDYTTEPKAQARMNQPGSHLPFVLGPGDDVPGGVPYLIDSHHTISALEASGHHAVHVTLKKIGDWSHLEPAVFYQAMQKANFMNGTDRIHIGTIGTGSDHKNHNPNVLPVPVDVAKAIPKTIPDLKDDPWRSLAALVRKVENKKQCRPDYHKTCLRGYLRECKKDNSMTPFFEFRWAYFMNDAYNRGCGQGSYWDDPSECQRFQDAYRKLMQTDVGAPIRDQNSQAWQRAAKLLVPLCRGAKAETYKLPEGLGPPMGGEELPGHVSRKDMPVKGKDKKIQVKDPSCAPPKCPDMPMPPPGFLATAKK